jgi:hypothetical protein
MRRKYHDNEDAGDLSAMNAADASAAMNEERDSAKRGYGKAVRDGLKELEDDGLKLNRIHKALSEVADGPVIRARDEEEQGGAAEVIFNVPTPDPRVAILVYTSFTPYKRTYRGEGQDAIKFVIRYTGNKETKYVGKLKKVHRTRDAGKLTENALERICLNVQKEVRKIMELAVPLTACKCGSLLVPRWYSKKRRWFLGCMAYPKCEETKNPK